MASDQGRSDRPGKVGDDTLARIDGLADGWSVNRPQGKDPAGPGAPAAGTPPATPAAAESVAAPDTVPYPKLDVEDDDDPIDASTEAPTVAVDRKPARPSGPPPSPPAAAPTRAKPASIPPPPPGSASRAARPSAPPPPPPPGSPARAARPSAPPPPPPARSTGSNPVKVVSSKESDNTVVTPPGPPPPVVPDDLPASGRRVRMSGTGTLRIPVGLPRRRGVLGDIQYVYTVVFGVARARRQLAELDRLLDEAKATREQRMVELGRQSAADGDLALPIVEQAREQLVAIDEARSQRAGQVAACDEELEVLAREREAARVARAAELARHKQEIERIADSLEPLDKALTGARRKAQRLGSQLGVLDEKIAGTELSLSGAAKAREKPDAAAVEAAIASLRAERETIAAEEPVIAAAIDDIEPKIASLRASRAEAEKAIAELERIEKEDVVRLEEIRAAIVARKTVEERAVGDLAAAQTRALRELGERLYVERPAELDLALAPVERSDLRIGELQRRLLELADLVGAVNRRALARGIAWLTLIALVIGGALAAAFLLGWL